MQVMVLFNEIQIGIQNLPIVDQVKFSDIWKL